LKSLDGSPIEPSENNEAKEHFGGKLTCDFIAEKFQSVRLNDIKSLEFPQCGIKVVDLGASIQSVSEQFENLRAINLENNALTSFSGLVYLRNLKILCLNNNKIESIFPKTKNASNSSNTLNDLILPNLEVLHLAFNGINDLVTLQIGRLVSLKALFLQGSLPYFTLYIVLNS
jgi:Leucine-rich repeat (LRR) protein